MPAIPYVRLRAIYRAEETARLPGFKGSMLRGAFGHALRKAVCAMGPQQRCESCSLRGPCVYTRIFETFIEGEAPPLLAGITTSPRPYVFEPRTEARELAPGDLVETDLLLLGQATELQPFVLLVLERMAELGFGTRRARFGLTGVNFLAEDGSWRAGYRAGGQRWPGSVAPILTPDAVADVAPERLTLRFLTPTRIQKDGTPQRTLPFRALVFQMLRRVLELAHFHVPGAEVDWHFRPLLERTGDVRVTRSDLTWRELTRYSNRQRGKLPLSGFVGEIDLEGDLAPFLPLLRTAEIVHLGKGTAFGLGQVEVLR
jgi:CRISPR-associated endoribonuclease Cas6